MHLSQVQAATGMIIPIWYPKSLPAGEVQKLLAACLADAAPFAASDNVLAIVDGAPYLREPLRRLEKRLGTFRTIAGERNEGKGGAVAQGIQRLLANPAIRFIVIRDHDNDHLANDALNLVRLSAHIQSQAGTEMTVVIGRRQSIHRHLGFARGEYETLMNEVIMDAVRFAVSRAGGALNTQFSAAYDLPPDLQSGFKCYSRAAAQRYLDVLAQASHWAPGLDVRRHGSEVPVLVETWLAGGIVGEIQRASMEQPPFTTYDSAGKIKVKGTVLVWTLQRTEVPLTAARQFLLNALARRNLAKDDQGRSELLALANWVLKHLADYRHEPTELIETISYSGYF
ncbi:MAG: hypothetical protein PHW60_08525 [Kiritimatiellae bacterium]|nr:hypothetical protein [Kiritimatiellia bacterium]